MKRVLVTGGAGFIGSHLCQRLLREGDEVVCLDNFDAYYDPAIKRRNLEEIKASKGAKGFQLVEGDIRDKGLVDDLFRRSSFGLIIHLAARAGVRPSIQQPLLYEEVNVTGTLNLLEACRVFGVMDLIFGSSSSVYGRNPKVPFAEEDRLEAMISPYAVTKRTGELFCYVYHHLYGLNISCLRFFTVYGPRQRPEMAIHKFARLIEQGEKIPLYGDGTSRRDYTYIDDIIAGIMGAVRNLRGYDIFNLGESQTVPLRQLISLLEQALGKKAAVEELPEQPGDVPITYADITKSRRLLGYDPKVGIAEGVGQFVQWFRDMGKRGDIA
ncbi:MAG: epimerase [Deltaproteobacteria bacterium RBG_13_52_11]|nr:MAG: epimerase [Deltaproteobacteria bacterium RBG_13_52_11]